MFGEVNEDISCTEVCFVSALSFMSGEELNIAISQTIHQLRGWLEFRMLPIFRRCDLNGLIEYLECFMRGEVRTYELDYKKLTCHANFVLVELLVDLTNIKLTAYNYFNIEEMKELLNWLKES